MLSPRRTSPWEQAMSNYLAVALGAILGGHRPLRYGMKPQPLHQETPDELSPLPPGSPTPHRLLR